MISSFRSGTSLKLKKEKQLEKGNFSFYISFQGRKFRE